MMEKSIMETTDAEYLRQVFSGMLHVNVMSCHVQKELIKNGTSGEKGYKDLWGIEGLSYKS